MKKLVDGLEFFDFTDVKPIVWLNLDGSDGMSLGCLEIEVDNAVTLEWQLGEQLGIEDVHSVESQFFIFLYWAVDPFVLSLFDLFPSDQQVLFIEEQFPGGSPVLGQQPSHVVGLGEAFIIITEGNVADDIDVMDEDG